MITYIIDGNNLIGQIPSLNKIQRKNKQASREKLAFMLDNYFMSKKNKVFLHFDGFKADAIKTNQVRIIYSEKMTADDTIKRQIEQA